MVSGRLASNQIKSLPLSFYRRNTQVVAFELIGKVLRFDHHGTLLSGKIVETEAYFGAQDPASHAYRGLTPRNKVMFGPAGKSYVYFTYGNHHCLNIVTEETGTAGAVLIRALEPLSGISIMKKNRMNQNEMELTNGPGKLTRAFGITRAHSGLDLTAGDFCVTAEPEEHNLEIQAATRIGISRAIDLPLRFYLKDNSFVSKL